MLRFAVTINLYLNRLFLANNVLQDPDKKEQIITGKPVDGMDRDLYL